MLDSTVTVPLATVSDWAQRITECWRASVQAILEVGRLLAAAKDELPHGEFGKMIESELPFSASTANRLMKISADPKLSNPAHVQHLPASWGTLYELTKLDDEQFEEAIEREVIRPDMERREITQTIKLAKRTEREQTLAAKQTALPTKKYGVIVADPEWRFEPWSRKSGMDRAADNHYPTSCLDVIKARDVPSIAAEDCVLFLWATAPMLPHALAVMEVWGFDYRSHLIWKKLNPSGTDFLGTGYWFRNAHELLLVGVKGKIPAPAMGMQEPSALEFPVGEHSQKPEEILQIIEDYFPTLPKIELNCRGPARPGWDAWGNEAEPTTERAAAPPDVAVPEPAPSRAPPSHGAGSPILEDLTIPDFLRRTA